MEPGSCWMLVKLELTKLSPTHPLKYYLTINTVSSYQEDVRVIFHIRKETYLLQNVQFPYFYITIQCLRLAMPVRS